ncbi:Protein CBR-TRA-4 [Caenorhabditis briggsae]|uniref:Protein CBR-TRA-4 n=1 Tax=Caenorhabditis briggsae TaxID=6238 RepID=A8XN82_CAEBR|nr:Protein CBR-TRA-4 [Caenorhabditis briggsae]CAP34313.1 Protein CBR-TRA-4 [Caenorhabditis briggsae]
MSDFKSQIKRDMDRSYQPGQHQDYDDVEIQEGFLEESSGTSGNLDDKRSVKMEGRRMMMKSDSTATNNEMMEAEDLDDEEEEDGPGLGYELLTAMLNMNNQEDDEEEEPVAVVEPEDVRPKLDGVGTILKEIRGEIRPPQKERIILDEFGFRERDASKFPICRIGEVQQTLALADHQEGIDFHPPPNAPTDVRVVRKMIRQKMVRCKKCKNRFIEKNIYERHLRDKHPTLYEEYIREQEEEVELQRLEEIEANRIEELQTGGFIPPESEISQPSEDPNYIPLPGENNGGLIPRFDYYGRIKQLKRPYKKKISPQCPFCDKRFRNEMSLKKHFLKKHEEMVEFKQCLKCFKCVESEEALERHDCELTYVCFECPVIRNLCTDHRLINHRKKFHRGANAGFRCSFCNMKFLTPRKLRKHKKMSHVFTKTYQCHFCEEIFISEVAVMTHERVHTGIIKFECKVCDFKANRYVAMEEHKKEEHGYVCAICNARHAEYPELKHHVYEEHGGYLAADEPSAYVESPRMWLLYKGE